MCLRRVLVALSRSDEDQAAECAVQAWPRRGGALAAAIVVLAALAMALAAAAHGPQAAGVRARAHVHWLQQRPRRLQRRPQRCAQCQKSD